MSSNDNTVRVELELDGDRTVELDVPAGKTVLKTAEKAGCDLRSGCRKGRCTSCTGRLLEGEVNYVETPEALTKEQREQGYVSLCIATPEEECRILAGDQVLVEAFPNLWYNLDADPPD